MSTDASDEHTVRFGRLSLGGQPLTPDGSWMLTERHGDQVTSFIALTTAEARSLRDQIDEKLTHEAGGEG